MSDEEKKALERIDYIQDFIIENGQYNADVNDMEYFSRIKNLIEKQSKEIEKYKNVIDNREFTWKQKYEETFEYVKENYTSKDKIKAKIEELNHVKENSKGDLYRVATNFALGILQSLLEKE